MTDLASVLDLPPALAGLLVRRGMNTPEAARDFLHPSLGLLPSPFLLPELDQAVDRLIQAISCGEPITVYGDYDADGLTAAVLLAGFLADLGARVTTYVPHRMDEGYGLNPGAVERLARSGTRLIVTVDCGVADHEAVLKARELGLDVIITDHHQTPPSLPPALAVINPHRFDSLFPYRPLAGVGVAFFVAGGLRQVMRQRGLLSRDNQPELAPFLGLVAIGTVADVAPLTGVNRILVKAGLKHLAVPCQPGLAALKAISSIEQGRPLTAREVAFRIAPRLNAAGRIDSPQPGLRLLQTRDAGQAEAHAAELDRINRQRRRLQSQVLDEAIAMLEETGGPDDKTIVLAREGWHPGVVGLAAARLAEKYQRPAILLTLDNGLARGSGRSIRGFNLFRALDQCRDLLVRFGGHEQAAGLTLEIDRIPLLASAFERIAASEIDEQATTSYLDVDAEITLEDLDRGWGEYLSYLAPFGEGNPEPIFTVSGLSVLSAGCVGTNHLKLTLTKGSRSLDTIGFSLGHLLPELGPRVGVVIQRHTTYYRGRTAQGWKVVDIRREDGP